MGAATSSTAYLRRYRSDGRPRARIALSGLGMVSSLGPDAVCGCAAARAGLVRTTPVQEHLAFDPSSGAPEPILAHAVPALTRGFRGFGRLVRLAVPAFAALVQDARLRAAELSDTAVIVVLPSGFHLGVAEALDALAAERDDDVEPLLSDLPREVANEGLRAACRARLVAKMLAACEGGAPRHRVLLFEDQAGLGTALLLAIDLLTRGEAARCIVGGVDSYVDPDHLAAAEALDTLKTPSNPVGFMPGEAAAFVLVEPLERAKLAERPVLATIDGIAHRGDAPHQFARNPAHGCVLADVVAHADGSTEALGRACGLVVGGCNGTEWNALQWGHALPRLSPTLRDAPHWHPVASFGEAGAATGFLGLSMAARAHAAGHAPGPASTVWALSAGGPVAAIALSTGG